MSAPQELDGAKVLRYAVVAGTIQPTGATRHVVGGDEMPPAAALAVARYDAEVGFYLFYLDQRGNVVTDTWHESLDAALDQAEFEYSGLKWVEPA